MNRILHISKGFKFEAAHQLPNYVGKCAELHGHTYTLQVTVGADPAAINLDKSGILIDFGVLKRIVNEEIIEKYDHKYLNDFFPVPSAEVMVLLFTKAISDRLLAVDSRLRVTRVRLYEGAGDNYAEVTYV